MVASFKFDKLLPTETHESLFEQIFDSLIKTFVLAKVNLSKLDVELFVEESKQGSVIFLPFTGFVAQTYL
ncbi:hypothetical protein B4S17_08815 [Acinetobacter baumannii]|nr:hypothetical protein SG96_0210405 [Acinetobacter baumannii]OOS80188.1 hypothetical protein BTH22_08580 [Acinetobacter baumannii]OOS98753.1 hypothetical protein BTH26_07130 [Acinetobacter baumannii]OOT02963.1 hypothetical protein BTH32_09940 [Acinetobacter baumannii]OOT19813.1 hypothetical protein BTH30_04340 [Acinetobacter baumannii]